MKRRPGHENDRRPSSCQVLNALEVDYVVLGNHEFDYGAEILQDRIAESKFK